MTLVTSNTYQPNCVFTGPVRAPFFAEKIASSNAFSCWPLATPGSLPPCAFEASSIEYFFATAGHAVPFCSAAFAWFAFALVLVSTTRRSRVSGWPKLALFLL